MKKKMGFILASEEYFGSRTALGSLVRCPVNPWLQMIPGMFIYEAYKRSRERRLFAQHFMHPRRIAMKLAEHRVTGGDPDELADEAHERIRKWLSSAGAYDDTVFEAASAVVDSLRIHYEKLLRVQGASYADLVIAVYETRERYEAYLHELARLEDALDRAVLAKFEYDETLREELFLKQKVKEDLRVKDTNSIF